MKACLGQAQVSVEDVSGGPRSAPTAAMNSARNCCFHSPRRLARIPSKELASPISRPRLAFIAVYAKIGVSARGAAAMFAMRHGLLDTRIDL
jgi:hypothetical protein